MGQNNRCCALFPLSFALLLIVACSDDDSENTAETIGDAVVDSPSIDDSLVTEDTTSLSDAPEITDSLPNDDGQLADGDGVDVEDSPDDNDSDVFSDTADDILSDPPSVDGASDTDADLDDTTETEPDEWWRRTQVWGMTNYWTDTSFERVDATHQTVNGYNLVFELDPTASYLGGDIVAAHARGVRFLVGITFSDLFSKHPADITYLQSLGVQARDLDGDSVFEDFGGEQRHFFSFAFSTFRDVLIEQAQRIVDLGADGIVVIYPDGITHTVNHAFFGVAGFDTECIAGFRASLEAEYTTEQLAAMGIDDISSFDYGAFLRAEGKTAANLLGGGEDGGIFLWDTVPLYDVYRDYMNQLAVDTFGAFNTAIREYADEGFAIGTALHGLNILDLLKYIDQIDFISAHYDADPSTGELSPESIAHDRFYRLMQAIDDTPLVLMPVDASYAQMVTSWGQANTDVFLQMKMAEAYTFGGAHHDVYQHGFFGLEESMATAAFAEYSDFVLSNLSIFDAPTTSLSPMAVVLTASSFHRNVEFAASWHVFNRISTILSLRHFQYDIVFNGDGTFGENTMTAEDLSEYELVLVMNPTTLLDDEITLFNELAAGGLSMIYVAEHDDRLSLSGFETGTPNDMGEPITTNCASTATIAGQSFTHTITACLDYRVVGSSVAEGLGIQVWRDLEEPELYIHVINYDVDSSTGLVNPRTEVEVSVILPDDLPVASGTARLLRPGFVASSLPAVIDVSRRLTVTIPNLEIWAVIDVVLE